MTSFNLVSINNFVFKKFKENIQEKFLRFDVRLQKIGKQTTGAPLGDYPTLKYTRNMLIFKKTNTLRHNYSNASNWWYSGIIFALL